MRPLVHIGYHKTGTSWLQRDVFRNAGAGFSVVTRKKALRQALVSCNPFEFDPEITRGNFEPRIREIETQNLVAVLTHEGLSGNPHRGGLDSKTIADRLAAVFPNARVLVGIREQTSMLISLYKQYVKRGGVATFKQYANPSSVGSVLGAVRFRFDFLEYHRLIGYYQDLFGAANVLVLPQELLRTQAQAFLERIGKFLNVPTIRAEYRMVNASPSALSLSLKRRANRYVVRELYNSHPLFALEGSNKALLRICDEVDKKSR
jgi:hypothetical protein